MMIITAHPLTSFLTFLLTSPLTSFLTFLLTSPLISFLIFILVVLGFHRVRAFKSSQAGPGAGSYRHIFTYTRCHPSL